MALVLQALALAHGTVVVVQPLLVGGLLFAVPLSARAESRAVLSSELLGVTLCVIGLAGFIVVSDPTAGVVHQPLTHGLAVTLPLLAVAAIAGAIARIWTARRALLLAFCSGVLVGLGAGLLKLVVHGLASRGFSGAFSWQMLALLIVGGISAVTAQSAFQAAGELGAPLAILTLAEPITAVIVGVSVLHERIATSGPAVVAETIAALLSTVGVWLLATSPVRRQPARRIRVVSPRNVDVTEPSPIA
jgi:hypothetical protein